MTQSPTSRRSVLAGLAAASVVGPAAAETRITGSRGPQVFDRPPRRILSLNWALAEQLIDLDTPPLGIADPAGYRDWVRQPELPADTIDLGKRDAPNGERILSLDPDLILIAGEQIVAARRLESIAPVLHFEQFSADHDNAATARRIFLDLGRLLGREDLARERLAAMGDRLAALKTKIATAYPDGPPPVAVIRFIDDKRVVIYGRNGMPEAALSALGLRSPLAVPNSQWGLAFKPVTALAGIEDGLVLHIEPFEHADALFGTALWQAMPFVRDDRFAALPPLWTYGGALSIGRIGEAVARVLLARPS